MSRVNRLAHRMSKVKVSHSKTLYETNQERAKVALAFMAENVTAEMTMAAFEVINCDVDGNDGLTFDEALELVKAGLVAALVVTDAV